jgi:hypothetical protein
MFFTLSINTIKSSHCSQGKAKKQYFVVTQRSHATATTENCPSLHGISSSLEQKPPEQSTLQRKQKNISTKD